MRVSPWSICISRITTSLFLDLTHILFQSLQPGHLTLVGIRRRVLRSVAGLCGGRARAARRPRPPGPARSRRRTRAACMQVSAPSVQKMAVEGSWCRASLRSLDLLALLFAVTALLPSLGAMPTEQPSSTGGYAPADGGALFMPDPWQDTTSTRAQDYNCSICHGTWSVDVPLVVPSPGCLTLQSAIDCAPDGHQLFEGRLPIQYTFEKFTAWRLSP